MSFHVRFVSERALLCRGSPGEDYSPITRRRLLSNVLSESTPLRGETSVPSGTICPITCAVGYSSNIAVGESYSLSCASVVWDTSSTGTPVGTSANTCVAHTCPCAGYAKSSTGVDETTAGVAASGADCPINGEEYVHGCATGYTGQDCSAEMGCDIPALPNIAGIKWQWGQEASACADLREIFVRQEGISFRQAHGGLITGNETDLILQRSFEYITALMEFNLVNLEFHSWSSIWSTSSSVPGLQGRVLGQSRELVMGADWEKLVEVDEQTEERRSTLR